MRKNSNEDRLPILIAAHRSSMTQDQTGGSHVMDLRTASAMLLFVSYTQRYTTYQNMHPRSSSIRLLIRKSPKRAQSGKFVIGAESKCEDEPVDRGD